MHSDSFQQPASIELGRVIVDDRGCWNQIAAQASDHVATKARKINTMKASMITPES